MYITNLPLDADEEEVRYVFSKCGVIAEEIDSGKPRIRLYENEDGKFKGDALVVYFRGESVDLAIQMLDDTDFRLGQGMPAGRMKVTVADFSYKKQTEAPTKSNTRDKQKIIKRTQKLNRLAGNTLVGHELIGPIASWLTGMTTTLQLCRESIQNGIKWSP